MPANSTSLSEEGILLNNLRLVSEGHFNESEIRDRLSAGAYPARNADQNIADLRAQAAANQQGVTALYQICQHYGIDTVQAYMQHVQDHAEEAVRQVIDLLKDGAFTTTFDDGSTIQVRIQIDKQKRQATLDFSGSSEQRKNNFNAPKAVTQSAILYVFRTLINDDIPLNEGCLRPIQIIIPEGSMLAPLYPAAVAAGNVETSQVITDTLFAALGLMASSQGTMNNLCFGNGTYQYYETLCGGSGAGSDFHGTSAVHTHMTNSRLTDPEVLESRFPVQVNCFEIRRHSGGLGRFQGGNGVHREILFLEHMSVSILANRRIKAPFALAGGGSGAVGKNWLQKKDGTRIPLSGRGEFQVDPGDCFVIETPGGGGFGKIT